MTTSETTTTPAVSDADRQLAVETMRTLIATGLTELETLIPLVGRLVDSHQRGLGFLTVESKLLQDDMLRKERAARYPGRDPRPVGQSWFARPDYVINASGDRPAPGNLSAYNVLVDTHLVLADLIRFITARLRAAGLCLIAGAPVDPTIEDLTRHLRTLVGVLVNVEALDQVSGHVERLVDQAKKLVDGDDKKKHPDPCPHCGRQTLVIYITRGVIRCDEDPITGRLEPCRCSDSYCPCRFGQGRHEWHRKTEGKTQRSWWHLRDLLTIAERAREEAKK